MVTLSPAQWCSSMQLWLSFCALLVSCQCSDSVHRLSGSQVHSSVKVVTEAFSDIPRYLPANDAVEGCLKFFIVCKATLWSCSSYCNNCNSIGKNNDHIYIPANLRQIPKVFN